MYVLTNINFIPVLQIYHLYGSVFITLVPIVSDETRKKDQDSLMTVLRVEAASVADP